MNAESERRADALFAGFEEWARETEVDLFVVEAVLDWRLEGRGDPAVLSPDDVRELLTAWIPRQVTLPQSECPMVLSTLRHWVDFLAHDSGQVDRSAVLAAVDRYAAEFTELMGDERAFGLAKFWATRMREHDVDTDDQDEVRRFIAAVNAGEVDYDRDVLDEIMRRHGEGAAMPSLPPVFLPAESELVALAGDSVLLARFRTVLRWLGAGRALTSTNRLRVADARELAALLGVDGQVETVRTSADLPMVTSLVTWARSAGLVRLAKGRLLPVKSAAGLLDRPLDLWRRVCLAAPKVGPALTLPPSRDAGAPVLGPILEEVIPQLWLSLYTAGGGPVPVELLAQFVRETASDLYQSVIDSAIFGFREVLWRGELAGLLDSFAAVGIIGTTEFDEDLAAAHLTPLGLWAAREVLSEAGYGTPLIGDLSGGPWAAVCEAVREVAPEVAGAVVSGWLGARSSAEAAAEVAGHCGASERADRMLSWNVLGDVGADGVEHARRLRAEGGLTGAMAADWLVRAGVVGPESLTRAEAGLAIGEQLAGLDDDGVLIAELGSRSVDEQVGIVRALVDGEHPDREALLAVIGGNLGPEVAAVARG